MSDTNEPDRPTPPVFTQAQTTGTRPRGLAIAAVVAAAAGLLLCLGGFVPVPGLATVLTLIGGLLLVAGVILSIVVLVSRRQGAKPVGIVALVISVLGGILFAVAFFASLVWLGVATADRGAAKPPVESAPSSSPSSGAGDQPSNEPSQAPSDEPSASSAAPQPVTVDEQAFLDAVRPELVALLQEAQPGTTEEQVDALYDDETLLDVGRSFAQMSQEEGGVESERETFVDSMVAGGATEDTANRFFDTLTSAAQQYLTP